MDISIKAHTLTLRLKKLKAEGIESGPKRQIKTPAVNAPASPPSTCEPIDKKRSVTAFIQLTYYVHTFQVFTRVIVNVFKPKHKPYFKH